MTGKDDSTWARLIGPTYTGTGVARRLGITEAEAEAMSARHELWALQTADNATVFPASQFTDDGQVLPGLKEVLDTFPPHVADCWTIAAWLTATHPDLDDMTVLECLRNPPAGSATTPQWLAGERASVWAH